MVAAATVNLIWCKDVVNDYLRGMVTTDELVASEHIENAQRIIACIETRKLQRVGDDLWNIMMIGSGRTHNDNVFAALSGDIMPCKGISVLAMAVEIVARSTDNGIEENNDDKEKDDF